MALALTFVAIWPPELQEAGERVLAALNQVLGTELPTGTINLKLVDDTEIARLNKQYTGNAYATDVLTFPYSEGEDSPIEGELADVAISQPMAAKQAEMAGNGLVDEISLLITHGVLHALGFDHSTESEQQQVDGLQRRIVELAGYQYRDFVWKD